MEPPLRLATPCIPCTNIVLKLLFALSKHVHIRYFFILRKSSNFRTNVKCPFRLKFFQIQVWKLPSTHQLCRSPLTVQAHQAHLRKPLITSLVIPCWFPHVHSVSTWLTFLLLGYMIMAMEKSGGNVALGTFEVYNGSHTINCHGMSHVGYISI